MKSHGSVGSPNNYEDFNYKLCRLKFLIFLLSKAKINSLKNIFTIEASITLIGSVVGTPVGGFQSDLLGRKTTMMATQVLTLLGFLCLRFAESIEMFYIGAFLGGYTEGVYLFISALYTAEINQPKIRNYTMSFNMLSYFLMFYF